MTRHRFLEDAADIGISHRSVRLRTLQRVLEKAEERNNLPLAMTALKQAAEEMGGAYTNRRELTGKNGAPLPPVNPVVIYQLPDNGR